MFAIVFFNLNRKSELHKPTIPTGVSIGVQSAISILIVYTVLGYTASLVAQANVIRMAISIVEHGLNWEPRRKLEFHPAPSCYGYGLYSFPQEFRYSACQAAFWKKWLSIPSRNVFSERALSHDHIPRQDYHLECKRRCLCSCSHVAHWGSPVWYWRTHSYWFNLSTEGCGCCSYEQSVNSRYFSGW